MKETLEIIKAINSHQYCERCGQKLTRTETQVLGYDAKTGREIWRKRIELACPNGAYLTAPVLHDYFVWELE